MSQGPRVRTTPALQMGFPIPLGPQGQCLNTDRAQPHQVGWPSCAPATGVLPPSSSPTRNRTKNFIFSPSPPAVSSSGHLPRGIPRWMSQCCPAIRWNPWTSRDFCEAMSGGWLAAWSLVGLAAAAAASCPPRVAVFGCGSVSVSSLGGWLCLRLVPVLGNRDVLISGLQKQSTADIETLPLVETSQTTGDFEFQMKGFSL